MPRRHQEILMTSFIRIVSILAVSASLVFVSACSSTSGVTNTTASLPVETSTSIASARVSTRGDVSYVTGSAKPGPAHPITHSSHVDVQLIGPDGNVLAEREDRIEASHPRTVQGRNGRYAYTVSFPASLAQQARKVIVVYHTAAHGS